MTNPPTIAFPTDISSRIALCCQSAAEHEERSEDASACEILQGYWAGPGSTPEIRGLLPIDAARILTRAGMLTAKLGSQHQVVGWQERSKDMLSRAASLAEEAGNSQVWAEARKGLGTCYWREGAFDEARLTLCNVLERMDIGRWRFAALVELAMVERCSGQPQRAVEIYSSCANLLGEQSHFLQATYHNGLALALKSVGRIDEALIAMTAAAYHLEEAGILRMQIITEINLGNLFVVTKRFSEAHSHLDRAERLARQIRDALHLAQARDSRSLAYLEEGNYEAAESPARESVEILERGDQHALLVESLVTYGRVLSRLNDDQALRTYLRAYELAAERVGSEKAGLIAQEMLSELAGAACLKAHVTLDDAVDKLEKAVIRAALDASNGKQTEAALRLGLKQATLSQILLTRHSDLRPNPNRKPRKQSLLKRKP